MKIIAQRTIKKNSLLINPKQETFNSIVRPATSIGFTFDKQPKSGLMTFAVHVSLKIQYSAISYYLFEGYDGTAFDNFIEKPDMAMLLNVVKNAVKRLDEILNLDIKDKPLLFTKRFTLEFKDADILKLLASDIDEAYC